MIAEKLEITENFIRQHLFTVSKRINAIEFTSSFMSREEVEYLVEKELCEQLTRFFSVTPTETTSTLEYIDFKKSLYVFTPDEMVKLVSYIYDLQAEAILPKVEVKNPFRLV